MKLRTFIQIILALLGFAAAASHSTVIDFEATGQSVPGDCSGALTSTPSDGYLVTSSQHFICPAVSLNVVSNGTYILATDDPEDNTLTLTRAAGVPFSLHSIDLSETFISSSTARNVRFEGILAAGGSVLASFILDGIADGFGGVSDFETFAFPSTFSNLTSVILISSDPFALDNVVVDVAQVPEPMTLTLLIVGMLGISYSKRALRPFTTR